MKLSVYIPRPGEYPDATPETIATFASEAEGIGYDAVAVSDHPFPVTEGRGHHALDPFIALTVASAATSHVRLHVNLAVAPYRNPFLLACITASLQSVSRGRLILGAGSGYLQQEFAALGVRFEDKREQTVATLDALLKAWQGEPVHAATKWWRAEGNRLHEAVEPAIPIWFGGNSRWAIEQAVISCDGWSPHEVSSTASRRIGTIQIAATEELAARVKLLHELCERHGRERPIEICFTRNLPHWQEKGRQAILDELGQLRDLGITWLCVRFQPPTAGGLPERLSWFRELVAELA